MIASYIIGLFFPLLVACLPTSLQAATGTDAHRRGTMPDPKASVLNNIAVTCSRSSADDLYACNIKFNWVDPNAQNKSASCTSSWNWDGVTNKQGPTNSYSTEYVTCKKDNQEYFEFQFSGMNSPAEFGLDLAHRFKYDLLPAPANFPLMFSHSEITLSPVVENANTLVYTSFGTFNAGFYGMTA